jgi:asparagine synthase (glutamine-hydrolysing)
MCGIYGSTIQYSDDTVLAKLDRIRFRGPDFSSHTRNDDVILGHNRLAIIDLDPRSNQPFKYEFLTIVFNGEIYNYQQIKSKLIAKGYKFTTSSDTEVICAAYIEYGEKCLNDFNGMFSFVIYNEREKILFGARDRLGKKPFYYAHTSSGFEFSSQPSAIALDRDLTISHTAINEFLFCGYIPDPLCIYAELKKLPAGCCFTYDIYKNDLKVQKYWELDFNWSKKYTGSYTDAREELKEILNDAVKIRMNADVPLGVFLSSGIDSSLVAAIASAHHSDVKTFNVSFNEKGYDESEAAGHIASFLGTNHFTIECNYKEGIGMIETYAHFYDEPFADSSAIPGLLLAKHTKKYVTVALTGDGGDESFLGYDRYRWMDNMDTVFKTPLVLRKAMAWFVGLSPNYRHKLIAMGVQQTDIETLYIKLCGGMDHPCMLEPYDATSGVNYSFLANNHKPLLERIADYDIKTYLNGDINTKVDRSSMAYAIESRAPLMDYRVVEFARSLPTAFKMQGNVQKRILRDILFEKIPANIYNRPKSGFKVPLRLWFKNELKEYVLDTLNKSGLSSIPGIDAQKAELMIAEHMAGKWNRTQLIWSLLILKQWLQKHNEHVSYKNEAVLS